LTTYSFLKKTEGQTDMTKQLYCGRAYNCILHQTRIMGFKLFSEKSSSTLPK